MWFNYNEQRSKWQKHNCCSIHNHLHNGWTARIQYGCICWHERILSLSPWAHSLTLLQPLARSNLAEEWYSFALTQSAMELEQVHWAHRPRDAGAIVSQRDLRAVHRMLRPRAREGLLEVEVGSYCWMLFLVRSRSWQRGRTEMRVCVHQIYQCIRVHVYPSKHSKEW